MACGVDIGSTNLKVVVTDESGAVRARSSRSTPRSPFDLTIDPIVLMRTIEDMILEVCGPDFQVQSLASAGVGEDGVLVDTQLRPLTTALAWFDPRRQRIHAALTDVLGDDGRSDSTCDPASTVIGWAWARSRAEPGSGGMWIALADLPGVLLSRNEFLSDSLASRTGAWSSLERRWNRDRVSATLGTLQALPPVIPAGTVLGPLRSQRLEQASVLGSDPVVVVGGHDHPIASWGLEQAAPGSVLDSMGTAEVVVAQSPRAVSAHPPEVDISAGIRSRGTTLLRVEELSRNISWASQDDEVSAQIRALVDGRTEPVPVLDSGYFVPGPRGGGTPAYAPDTPRDPSVRAASVLGALARSGAEAIEAIRLGTGRRGDVCLAGGWARSPGWVAIKARVNGFESKIITEPELTAVSAALLSARSLGWDCDPATAIRAVGQVPPNSL